MAAAGLNSHCFITFPLSYPEWPPHVNDGM
jgi:hypothetical protein